MTESKTHKKRLITRRRVLAGTGAVVGAATLGLGGYIAYGHSQRFGRDGEVTIPDHRIELAETFPRLVISRGQNPAVNTRAVVDRMGGMGQFVGSSDVVVIKPNIGWERSSLHAATTHPVVVAEVVRMCLEQKPQRVIVCDCPVAKNSRRSFELSGIEKAALEAGAEVIAPEESTYKTVTISERLGSWDILDPFIMADKIINVPVAKHHSLTGVTAGMKNWIGITTKLRALFHGDIHRSIAELAYLMRPTLTVMDATRVLMAKGPKGGSLSDVKATHTIAASVDPVAIDAWAGGLFGLTVDELADSIYMAEEMGLGKSDFKSIGHVEITPS